MVLDRRIFLGLAAGTAGTAIVGPAWALSEGDARAHVQRTIDDLMGLLQVRDSAASIAPKLRIIMESRANLPQIAKFSAGRVWLDMSEGQRSQYLDAFAHFVASVYARRFQEFSGNPQISIGRVQDAGRKGFLVSTPVVPPSGQSLVVEWLVSDRGGRIEIVDLVVEGISMAVTQREEIAAMYESRGRDIDQLIAKLKGERAG